jgi:hypothetical protein
MNRPAAEAIRARHRGSVRLGLRNFDPVRPVMVALILAAMLGLTVLILLLSLRRRPRRAEPDTSSNAPGLVPAHRTAELQPRFGMGSMGSDGACREMPSPWLV